MLTKRDLSQIRQIIGDELDIKLDEKLNRILDEKLRHLPSKDDFYKKMDEIVGELKTIREEQKLIAYRSSEHKEQLEKLAKIHPKFQHI